jgi:hypothetical protein
METTQSHRNWRTRRGTIAAGTDRLIAIRSTCGRVGTAYARHDLQTPALAIAARFEYRPILQTLGRRYMVGHSALHFVPKVPGSWLLRLLFPPKPHGHSPPKTKLPNASGKLPGRITSG